VPFSSARICLAYVVIAACSSSGSGISIRPGVSTVHVGQRSDTSGCLVVNVDSCPGLDDVAIADVDHDGARVALVITNNQTVTLVLSEDGGVTWSTHDLIGDLLSDFGWNQAQVGVHLSGGEIFILYTQDRFGAGGLTYTDLLPLRVDQTTWTLSRIGSQPMMMGIPYKRDDGHLRLEATDGDFRGGFGFPHFQELEPSTDTVTDSLLTCTGNPCNHAGSWTSPNRGDTFHSFSADIGQVCLLTAGTSGDTAQHCIPVAQWPAPTRSYAYPVLYASGVPNEVWSMDGQVYASAMTASGVTTTALGAGTIGNYWIIGRLLRPRFGGFQLAEEADPPMTRAAQGRLVSLDNGPEEVAFPATPCTNDDDCGYTGASLYGYRLVQWIEPVAADADLVFWVVQSEASGANQQTLYVERVTPTRTPITATPPDLGPLPGYPGIEEMTALEKQCARYVACYAGGNMPGDPLGICINHFTFETSFCAGLPGQRDTFLAATDCASLVQAWPNFGQNDPPAYCPPCNGGTNCVPTPPPCDPTPQCVGGVYQQCDASQNVDIRTRCDLMGLACNANPTMACSAPDPGSAACSQNGPISLCQGNYLLNCEGNEYHYVDCTTLGFTGCQTRGQIGFCQ
jgi:hypothetical protein